MKAQIKHASLIYRAWRYRLKVEPAEIGYLIKHLRPGQTALDIGAHKGAFTYWMQSRVGRAGHVVAFEPQPILARRLAAALLDLKAGHVVVENLGLSDQVGELQLHVPRGGSPSPGATLETEICEDKPEGYQVRVTTLDRYFEAQDRKIDFMKCDVEGHELSVFRGAEQVLRRHRPTLMFECEARHRPQGSMQDVFSFIEKLGYRGQFFLKGQLTALANFSTEMQHDPKAETYANNFLFTT